MANEARRVVGKVLGDHMAAKVWTGGYAPVFPFTPQGYAPGALLPMMLYLFRWGHRRGRGKFAERFGLATKKPTIANVAEVLGADARFTGFDGPVGRAVLGDLLLGSALENRRHMEGHEEQVQRCFPNHYLASWIDLPRDATALRGVPEMLVSLINDQPDGPVVATARSAGRYRLGSRVEDNAFLRAFAPGMTTVAREGNLRSDLFDEAVKVGLDQLLTIRLAQTCGEAPAKAFGKGEPGPIPNQRPIAARAALQFREDFLTFFECFGHGAVPRLALLSMLESSIAVGMTSLMLASTTIIAAWEKTGFIPPVADQVPFPVFIDCSGSTEVRLRALSEQSFSLAREAVRRVPATLTYMRLLDFYVMHESDIARTDVPPESPDATARLNLLGRIASGVHDESAAAERSFRKLARALSDAEKQDGSNIIQTDILDAETSGRSHGSRLAEVLTAAYESVSGVDKLVQFLTTSLMTDEPNGLARRRRVALRRNPAVGQLRTGDALSFVLTNTVLEYLVHRHLHDPGKGRKRRDLSFPEFTNILRERYGFHIDRAPPNLEVPSEVLGQNRRVLERRLRDLGLLTGVNDAERMKKLKPRYTSTFVGASAQQERVA